MNISFSFDDNEVSVEDPLGSITISEGTGRIEARDVFLDFFFAALVEAYYSFLKTGFGLKDVEGERESIRIQRNEAGILIEYGQGSILLADLTEFENSLRSACATLLASLPGGGAENPLFKPIRDFIRSS